MNYRWWRMVAVDVAGGGQAFFCAPSPPRPHLTSPWPHLGSPQATTVVTVTFITVAAPGVHAGEGMCPG